ITDDIIQYFKDANSPEFASLLKDIHYEQIEEVEDHFLIGPTSSWILQIKVNPKVCKTLDYLMHYEKDRILKVLKDNNSTLNDSITRWTFKEDKAMLITPKRELLCDLLIIRSLLIRIATGKDTIQEKNDEYIIIKKQSDKLLASFSLDFKIDFEDLWKWFHFYKEHFDSYKERRKYVYNLFNPIIGALVKTKDISREEIPLTGWDRVDRVLSKTNEQLGLAQNEEDFQQIGLLCREIR